MALAATVELEGAVACLHSQCGTPWMPGLCGCRRGEMARLGDITENAEQESAMTPLEDAWRAQMPLLLSLLTRKMGIMVLTS